MIPLLRTCAFQYDFRSSFNLSLSLIAQALLLAAFLLASPVLLALANKHPEDARAAVVDSVRL